MKNGAPNYWRRAQSDRAAMLLDGAGYYGALRSSLLKAERSVYLVGWDIDSRTRIRGALAPDDGAPETLVELLAWLVERNKDLSVHVLLWDYSVLYSLEREALPRVNLDWRTPRRIRVCLDGRLPLGASRHEKLAIVDERVAYCGGLDLTIRRWDRSDHDADDPERKDPGGKPYGPYHDVQMVVDGETAAALAELVRSRWHSVAGVPLRSDAASSDPWPDGIEPDIRDIVTGISLTRPTFDGKPEVRQVEAAYLEAIGRAEGLLYIENQYLTAAPIARALNRRLSEQGGLEIVIVNPKSPHGWLEERIMGAGRAEFLRELDTGDNADRIAVLYPWTSGGSSEVPVMVHAKLMIVDDVVLHIGSSNLNSRSMGVDHECDLHFDARSDDHRKAIGRLRCRLIAHHLGVPDSDFEDREAKAGSAIAAIDSLKSPARGLSRLEEPEAGNESPNRLLYELGDPERPVDPDQFIGDAFGGRPEPAMRRHFLKLVIAAAIIATLVVVWRYSPLAQWAESQAIRGLLESVASSPWAGPLLLLAFVIGSFIVFPVTVLIGAVGVVLDPLPGFTWAFAGAMLAAAVNFACGRLISGAALEQWFGTWINTVSNRLQRGGIVSVMIVRNVPIAPFTVINVIAGATGIRFRDYLAGTALGMCPGIAALTLLGGRLRGALEDPDLLNFGLLLLAISIWIGIALGMQALSNRFEDAR